VLTDVMLRRAAAIDPPHLRSLDAVHPATALDARAATMIVCDPQPADAARAQGIDVLSPGA
jgi:hypothetical protein